LQRQIHHHSNRQKSLARKESHKEQTSDDLNSSDRQKKRAKSYEKQLPNLQGAMKVQGPDHLRRDFFLVRTGRSLDAPRFVHGRHSIRDDFR
jgi:hypothetical protein